MSQVTNAILTAPVSPANGFDHEIEAVNKFLRETEGGGFGQFIEVSEKAGGVKHMECRVYLSAFNHADSKIILQAIDQAPWQNKDMVQVFIKEQEDDIFRVRSLQDNA